MPDRLRISYTSQKYLCVTQAFMGEWHKGNSYSKWKHVWTLESAKNHKNDQVWCGKWFFGQMREVVMCDTNLTLT